MPDVVPTRSTEPDRPQFVDYGRDSGAVRRWARGTFTRENVSSGVKTLAWVVPLTVLIWVYAEREQLFKEQSVPIPVNVTSGDPTRVVTLQHPIDSMILADLQGPRSKIDDVRNEFSRSGGVESLEITLDRLQLAAGTHELRTASLVGSQSIFEKNGIVVSNCQPPTLRVMIDEYDTREVPIEPPPSVTNLVGKPIFEPPKVKIRAPRSEFDRAGDFKVYADLGAIPELSSPGSHAGLTVRVYTDALTGPNVSLAPGNVKATVEVRQADKTYVVPFMAVWPVMPMAWQKQFTVDGAPETIPNVTVKGPPDKIDLLMRAMENPGAPTYYAVLEIQSEDRPPEGQSVGPVRTRQLNFAAGLPDGVRVSPEDAQRTVDFKLVRRSPDG
jgi:hypothetical protein